MSKISELVKKSLKSRTLTYDITSYLFCKMGYGDINLAGQNARYRAFNSLKKEYSKYIGKTEFKEYQGDEKPRVWLCWLQGMDNAPELVKICYKSMQHYINDMEIVVLDESNLKDYITLPDYIYEKFEKGIIPFAQFTDIVRTELLIEHGGLWMDCTTYLTGPLPSYATEGDFFVFRDGFFDCEVINMENWFIFSKANNILLNETQNLLFKYWQDHDYMKNYFIMHLFFRMVSDYYADEWKKLPYFSQMNLHTFMMELNDEYSEHRFEQLKSISTVHKLSNKIDFDNDKDTFYKHLDTLYL